MRKGRRKSKELIERWFVLVIQNCVDSSMYHKIQVIGDSDYEIQNTGQDELHWMIWFKSKESNNYDVCLVF